MIIRSASNKTVKLAASLKTRKYRYSLGLFIIEGERFAADIPRRFGAEFFMCSESFAARSPSSAAAFALRAKMFAVSDKLFSMVSDTPSPQGILAVCRMPVYGADIWDASENPFYILLDGVADPGNVGAIARTAAAAGASAIVLSKGCADVYGPKSVRAAAGSVFAVPLVTGADIGETIGLLRDRGTAVYAACPDGETDLFKADFSAPSALIVGNESNGVSKDARSASDKLLRLPMPGGIESLNAAVSAGIFIYEAVRQRAPKTRRP